MEINFYLIRHGESEANVSLENKIVGRSVDVPLTSNGRSHAIKTGEFFKNQGIKFDAVYSSPANRTLKTGRLCLRAMDVNMHITMDERILEQDQGGWQGLSREIYKREDVRSALDNDNWTYIPGDELPGESQKMVGYRMKAWINSKVTEYSKHKSNINIAVFTHALAIKFLLAELLDLDRKTAYTDTVNPIKNASITVLTFINGNLVLPLKMRNYVEHL
jgi:broad specificity phosphatase PhoE